jgi:hypothetical protein
MRNLIKKILKEDFDWTESAREIVVGDIFDEEDISFNEENKVTIEDQQHHKGNEDGSRIVYRLGYDEEWMDHVMDGSEDWYLYDLITTGGYPNSYEDDYVDDDELNYFFSFFSEESINEFKLLLDRLHKIEGNTPTSKQLDNMISDETTRSLTSGPIATIGSYDFDDMSGEAMYVMGKHLSMNRWESLRNTYHYITQKNKVWIDFQRGTETIEVTVPFPYKGEYNISRILDTKLNVVFNYDWQEWWYEGYGMEGAEAELQDLFDKYLESLEDYILDNE